MSLVLNAIMWAGVIIIPELITDLFQVRFRAKPTFHTERINISASCPWRKYHQEKYIILQKYEINKIYLQACS